MAALAEGLAVVGVEHRGALVKGGGRLAGRFGVEELLACGADRVLPDLGGPEAADLLLAGAA